MNNPVRIWKTKDGHDLEMMKMDEEHLQKAFIHINSKLLHYHRTSCKFDELREQMEEVAEERGIVLKYPDEAFPSPKWGKFFSAIRKTRDMMPVIKADIEKAEEQLLNSTSVAEEEVEKGDN